MPAQYSASESTQAVRLHHIEFITHLVEFVQPLSRSHPRLPTRLSFGLPPLGLDGQRLHPHRRCFGFRTPQPDLGCERAVVCSRPSDRGGP
jgi:hypothetical protein